MNTKEILIEAFKRGHAWNPDFPNLQNLDEGRVSFMNGAESDAKDLIRSRQMSDSNYDALVLAFHKRPPDFDGEIGPATEHLVEIPRCPIPDFAPPPNARFHYDDPDLQKAVESMQGAAATGSGSWPAGGCDPERKGVHSMRIRINTAEAPQKVKDYLKQALDACVKCSAEMGMAKRYILDADSPAELTKVFERLSGNVIGWNYFPQPNTCNRITGRFSNSYAPEWRLWANLEEHETGHGYGLQHTRGHIMNPSILLVWPLTWKGGPSEGTMRRYFGGEPVVVPGDPDPPTPPSENLVFRGSFKAELAGKPLGEYILVPKPQV